MCRPSSPCYIKAEYLAWGMQHVEPPPQEVPWKNGAVGMGKSGGEEEEEEECQRKHGDDVGVGGKINSPRCTAQPG